MNAMANSVYVGAGQSKASGKHCSRPLIELGAADDWQHMIDSTTVRGHSQAAGAKGGLIRRLLVNRGGFTCKIHARTDGQGRPLGFVLTGGQVSDYTAVPDLLAMPVNRPKLFLGVREK